MLPTELFRAAITMTAATKLRCECTSKTCRTGELLILWESRVCCLFAGKMNTSRCSFLSVYQCNCYNIQKLFGHSALAGVYSLAIHSLYACWINDKDSSSTHEPTMPFISRQFFSLFTHHNFREFPIIIMLLLLEECLCVCVHIPTKKRWNAIVI